MKKEKHFIYIPLGGSAEIGMNMYVYGYGLPGKEDLILVDVGVSFPKMESTPGVDLIMANPSYVINNRNRLLAIFITHAHIGHYLGLMDLGLEIMNTSNIPVYVMPRMKHFILKNQPMAQLTENNNIQLMDMENNNIISFNNLSITPFEVPHRNELSETVGFRISSLTKSIIYLPDIDDWDSWAVNLERLVIDNDILFLDGTFYIKNEIQLRDVSKIPHPEIIYTMEKLSKLSLNHKKRVHFIHLNHTNDVIRPHSKACQNVLDQGFSLASENQIY